MKTFCRLLPIVLIALAASCTKAPKPKIDNVYEGLSENLPRLEMSILEGRRIVIDPGHGGHFAGALGQDGLEESMVNLGVGLYLWGLLREAGADVYMTRSAEKDFLVDVDSTVATDLQVRVEMVDSLNPDIVISLHHNAQAGRDPATNAVETYYKLGDPASRDLAFAVHRHLMRNLGIETGEVRPGNYYILRNVDVPAILGEASYLTNPKVEENLRVSEKQRLEAEAYFLGILDYFSRGTPRIERLTPGDIDTVLAAVPYLSYRVDDAGGLGIDPSSVDLSINGESVAPWLDPAGERIGYQPTWDMPNGWYDIELRVRNILGNTSQIDRFGFLLEHPVSQAVFSCFPGGIPSGGGTIQVHARVLDARGLPVADGVVVGVEISQRKTNRDKWDTVEWLHGNTRAELEVKNGTVEFPAVVPDGIGQVRLSVDGHEHILEASPDVPSGTSAFSLVDAATGLPVDRVVVASADKPLGTNPRAGLVFVPADHIATGDVWIRAPGYKPVLLSPSSGDSVAFDPWFGGALLGKRIVINPQGGFGSEPGLGTLGLSGAYVNLQVAKYLAEYLEAAGAEPLLTRRTEETLSDRDIVTLTNRLRADRYIEIRHNGRQPEPADSGRVVNAFYFPGSTRGEKFASDIQAALAESLDLPRRQPADRVTYPLQQTACPAIIIEPPGLAMIEEELRLAEPWYQRRQAFGIFCGVLTHFDGADMASLEVTIKNVHNEAAVAPGDDEAPGGEPNDSDVSNWLVTVENTWSLMSSPDGKVTFEAVPAGTLSVVAVRGKERIEPQRVVADKGSREHLVITLPRSR